MQGGLEVFGVFIEADIDFGQNVLWHKVLVLIFIAYSFAGKLQIGRNGQSTGGKGRPFWLSGKTLVFVSVFGVITI